jgi:hypothetical protein
MPRREFIPPFSGEVKILPDTKALGTIIRKLQNDTHAYKLKDLAYFFLDNPSSVLLKVKPEDDTVFFQCKICSFASTSQDDVVAHILTSHIADYFDAREVDVEPPKGNFSCVARCSLTGVLLGPPNIHEFNSVVREMIRTRFPNMSEEEYRSKIETVRDEALIEEWRKQAVKKTLYFPKNAPEGAAPLTREQAEGELRRNYLPSLVQRPKVLMITADKLFASPMKSLQRLARAKLDQERRSPQSMCYALHGAFHHRKLHLFRVNDARGQEFVTGVEYKPFDVEHAIEELRKVAVFIAENPCSYKAEIAPDGETEKQLNWLVSTGHVVAFTNGVFSAVEKFPKYGPQWRKKAQDQKEAQEPLQEPPVQAQEEPVQQAAAEQQQPSAGENNLTGESKDENSAELA